MAHTAVLFLLLSATSVFSRVNEARHLEIVQIVTAVIIDIANQKTGTILCWSFTAQPGPQPDDLLETIQQQPALRHSPRFTYKELLPRFVYNSSESFPTPEIIVLDLRYAHTNPAGAPSLMFVTLKSTFVLILISRSEDRYLQFIRKRLAQAALLNVFYLHTDAAENFYINEFSLDRTYFTTFPASIFPDHTRDLHGYRLRGSHFRASSYASFRTKGAGEISQGPFIDWIEITTRRINATFEAIIVFCDSIHECTRNRFYDAAFRPYDIVIDPVIWSRHVFLRTAVRSIMQTEQDVIAPRSRRLEIHELFGAPFAVEVWVTVVVMLVGCVLLTLLFPRHFHNNLILLTLCSFERVALYRVKRLEKLVAISLIIFFFVLMSAYESLFTALMTSRPRLPNPRTLDDLIKAGIRIQAWLFGVGLDYVDEELRPLIVNTSNSNEDNLTGHGYALLWDKQTLRRVLKFPVNFDYESGESRYVMLDYFRWKGFYYHHFAWENPLVDKFRFTKTALDEMGIFQKLMDDSEHVYYGARQHQILVRRFQSVGEILGLRHLSPAWVVLGFGWTLSLIALVAEQSWVKVRKAYSDRKFIFFKK